MARTPSGFGDMDAAGNPTAGGTEAPSGGDDWGRTPQGFGDQPVPSAPDVPDGNSFPGQVDAAIPARAHTGITPPAPRPQEEEEEGGFFRDVVLGGIFGFMRGGPLGAALGIGTSIAKNQLRGAMRGLGSRMDSSARGVMGDIGSALQGLTDMGGRPRTEGTNPATGGVGEGAADTPVSAAFGETLGERYAASVRGGGEQPYAFLWGVPVYPAGSPQGQGGVGEPPGGSGDLGAAKATPPQTGTTVPGAEGGDTVTGTEDEPLPVGYTPYRVRYSDSWLRRRFAG